MIALARAQGADVVLLDNELWIDSPYRPVLRSIAADSNVPLVDSLRLVEDARTKMVHDVEARLGLAAPPTFALRASVGKPALPAPSAPPARVSVVFRVAQGAFPVARALSIVGTDPQLGALVPNAMAMHDDGAGGDQRAGDGVWSLAASFAPGTRLSYVYTSSGARGQWEGLDVPDIRSVVVPESPDGRPVYLPIETFGRVYMQADDWHTDAVGYDLIGHAVANVVSLQQR